MEKTKLSRASIEAYKFEKLPIDIGENLEPTPECCIYRIPRRLREVNEKFYTPQLISIGPIHYGKKELVDMEKQKIRYKRKFGERIDMGKWEQLVTFIKDNEQRIRNCYAETFKLESLEFVTMILYDAIFVIELLLRNHHRDRSEVLLEKPQLKISIWVDLQLLENQLPYFLLKELYMLAFSHSNSNQEHYPSFNRLSCMFFQDYMFKRKVIPGDIKHFTDMIRKRLLKTCSEDMPNGVVYLPSVVKLCESGVKFKRIEGECLLDIRIEKKKRIIPFLEVVELQIPCIVVCRWTEWLLRNVMALEQCHYPSRTHVCHYIRILDYLIDTEKDVDLLVEKKIISYSIGNNAAIAELFNELNNNIIVESYNDIGKDVRAHYNNHWNHFKTTLRRVYFSNPWRSTGTVAAIILLLLTLIQAICSILQVPNQKMK